MTNFLVHNRLGLWPPMEVRFASCRWHQPNLMFAGMSLVVHYYCHTCREHYGRAWAASLEGVGP